MLGVLGVLGVFGAGLSAQAPAAPVAPAANEYGRVPKFEVQAFSMPGGRIKFEYPKKDWQLVPGGSTALVSAVQKQGQAGVVVEESKLVQALAPEDITDLFGQIESDVVKERQPGATDIQSKVIDAGGRRLVIVTYGRPGIAGPERVRQYSITSGTSLYRITCSAAAATFPRFEPTFAHLAASFAAAESGTH